MNNLYLYIKLTLKQWLCFHDWEYYQINKGYYDKEHRFVCRKCDKEQKED